jgi:hypothetical protein
MVAMKVLPIINAAFDKRLVCNRCLIYDEACGRIPILRTCGRDEQKDVGKFCRRRLTVTPINFMEDISTL